MSNKCIICEDSKIKPYKLIKKYQTVQCSKCNLIFVDRDKEPVNREPEKIFDEEYFKSYGMLDPEWRKELFSDRLYDIKKYVSGKKILDVGAGLGHFLKIAKDMGFEEYGVEPSVWGAEYARSTMNVNVKTGTLETNKYDENFFDIIHLNHVLENLIDPCPTISKMYDILNENGILYLSIPNIDALAKYFCDDYEWYVPQYRNYEFNKSTITKLLKKFNFNIVETKTIDGSFNYKYYIDKLKIQNDDTDNIDTSINMKRTGIKGMIDKIVSSLGLGQSLIVIANK